MILVTGGAGFIGSNLQAALARRGQETVVVDRLGSEGKWRNLAKHPPARLIPPDELDAFLESRPPLEMVFHLGADQRDHRDRRRPRLGDQCRAEPRGSGTGAPTTRCGSSTPPPPRPTATARGGFDDDFSLPALEKLRPLNLYGWTKHAFDLPGGAHAGRRARRARRNGPG